MAKDNKKMSLRADQVESELEGVGEGAEGVESILKTFELENASEAVRTVAERVDDVSHAVPIIKLILSGVILGFETYKSYHKLRDKPATKLRIFGISVNLGAALITVGIAIAAVAVPALIPIFIAVTIGVGVVKEIFNLAKSSHKYFEHEKELDELHERIKNPNADRAQVEKLVKEHQELSLRQLGKRWKIAHEVLDIVVGVLAVAAVGAAIATGPPGWIALAVIAIGGFGVKTGLTVLKNYKINKMRKAEENENKTHQSVNNISSMKIEHHLQSNQDISNELSKVKTRDSSGEGRKMQSSRLTSDELEDLELQIKGEVYHKTEDSVEHANDVKMEHHLESSQGESSVFFKHRTRDSSEEGRKRHSSEITSEKHEDIELQLKGENITQKRKRAEQLPANDEEAEGESEGGGKSAKYK